MINNNEPLLSHSGGVNQRVSLVHDHLTAVAARAAKYAAVFDAEEEAKLAGLLHDLGKYGHLFQKRLRNPGKVRRIDHWWAGFWTAGSCFRRTRRRSNQYGYKKRKG